MMNIFPSSEVEKQMMKQSLSGDDSFRTRKVYANISEDDLRNASVIMAGAASKAIGREVSLDDAKEKIVVDKIADSIYSSSLQERTIGGAVK